MTDPGPHAEELFGEALELPPESRSAFLDRVCSHDPELRRHLAQLLLEAARAASFRAAAAPFLFLTMRLLHGETLYARFEQSKKLDPGESADICKQLLAGVAALHAGGVIHRDLKPNNVMLETGQSREA